MTRLLFLIALAFSLVFHFALLLAGGQEKRRLPYRYLIPEGYVGWVRIDFNVENAPPLPIEDGYYLLKIPRNGRLKTSSQPMEVKGVQYYYFSESARYQLESSTLSDTCMVRDPFLAGVTDGSTSKLFRYLFVGPESLYEKHRLNSPTLDLEEDGYPKAGPRAWLTQVELEQLKVKHP